MGEKKEKVQKNKTLCLGVTLKDSDLIGLRYTHHALEISLGEPSVQLGLSTREKVFYPVTSLVAVMFCFEGSC